MCVLLCPCILPFDPTYQNFSFFFFSKELATACKYPFWKWPSSGEFDNCMKMKSFNKPWQHNKLSQRTNYHLGNSQQLSSFHTEHENPKQPYKKQKQSTSTEACKRAIFCLARSNKRTKRDQSFIMQMNGVICQIFYFTELEDIQKSLY